MYVSKFYAKRKPEKKLLSVRRETMMLVWSRVVAAGSASSAGQGGLGLSGSSGAHGGASGGPHGHGGQHGQFSGQGAFRNAYEGAIDIRDIKDVSGIVCAELHVSHILEIVHPKAHEERNT